MVRVRDIIKFGRVNFKISDLNCEKIDPQYTGSCYKPPETSRLHKRHTEELAEDEQFGPMEGQSMKNLVGLPNRQSLIENSLDINANMTDMNLVANDQTNI